MTRTLNIIIAALLCLLTCGCDSGTKGPRLSGDAPVHQELKLHSLYAPVPEVMTLYSVEAMNYDIDDPDAPKFASDVERFHEKPVLGKKLITDTNERQLIWDALNKGIQESNGDAANCFWPHHGLRIEQDGIQTDFLICFHCYQIEIYARAKKETALTTASAQPVFNQILNAANVPIARGAE